MAVGTHWRFLRVGSRTRSARGAAAVEFAVSFPVLIAVLIGAIDFARVFYWDMGLTTAARAGAQYGARGTTQAQDSAAMKAAALAAAQTDLPTLALSDITATCALKCEPDAPTTSTYSLTDPTGGNACTNASPSCSGGNHLIWTVTVTASKTFTTFARYPGVPSSLPITRRAVMRTQ
jgi:Flp pilus assembly protein TadG